MMADIRNKKDQDKKIQNKKNVRQRVYISLMLTLVALVAVTAATVAWFSIADRTKVNTMGLDIVADVEMRMDYYVYYTYANGDRCGLMDKDGNRITEPVYSKIEALNEHLFSFYLLDGETQLVKSVPNKS